MNNLIVLSLIFFQINLGIAEEAVNKTLRYKNQKYSSFNWENVGPLDKFLSFREWKNMTDIKAQIPDWEERVLEREHKEVVGRVLQCVGQCRVDRGETFFNSDYLTPLYERDDFQTIKDSYAWIFLFDGTMIRVAPESSITFNEYNVGAKENFINLRVNFGYLSWISRSENHLIPTNQRETDVLFYPNSIFEAQAIIDTPKYDEFNLFEMIQEPKTNMNQYESLNKLIDENNKMTKSKPTYAFIVLPNITIMGFNPNLEIISLLGGKSYIKNKSKEDLNLEKNEESELFLELRGFDKKDLVNFEKDKWLQVDLRGREVEPEKEFISLLAVGEFVTKRIPSILSAREIMLKKYSEFTFQSEIDPKKLAIEHGYRLWGKIKSEETKKEDLELRLEFLKEYFRRIETTNLVSSQNFKERLDKRGEKLKEMNYSDKYYSRALEEYYKFEVYNDDREDGEVLNSTTKTIWKRMHGIR